MARSKHSDSVRFHLTGAGWGFLLIAVLIGLATVKSQAPLIFIIFGGMMGALHVSAFMARRMVSSVRLRRDIPPRVWQNQTVHIGYFLQNTRRHGACLGLHVEETTQDNIEIASGYCVNLPPRGNFRAGARFAATLRGRLNLRGVRLSTRFPFGLALAVRVLGQEQASVLVWPARGRLRRQLLHRGAVETSSAAPSPATGGQDEFFGLREYRPDDNPRWIHWRRSASRSQPVVREMARPQSEILWVILDTRVAEPSKAAHAAREKSLRFAATLIDHAFARGYKVGLAMAFRSGVAAYPAAPGRGQRSALLDALALTDDNRQWGLAETLGRLNRSMLRQAQVIVISPNEAEPPFGQLRAIRGACRHLSVLTGRRIDECFDDFPVPPPEGE